jgi:hydroxymethylglutaryl-CoA lyase
MKIIECPRDAMQGIHDFIPTQLKADYINALLQVGFDTIDFGSFVSAKAIPQLSDTREVLSKLKFGNTHTKLLAIVANLRGVEDAISYEEINYIGFPFSISETFQQRNTNSSIDASLITVEKMLGHCQLNQKTGVVYLSMGFGNPYGDPYHTDIVMHRASQLVARGAKILSLSDTTGVSDPAKITELVPLLMQTFPEVEIGLHLHSTPETRLEKIQAAYQSGCKRFDSAIKGYGGCPMAADELTGNMATEELISFLYQQGERLGLDKDKWQEALYIAGRIFE